MLNVIALPAGLVVIFSALAGMLFPFYRAYFWLRYGYGLSYSGFDFLVDADIRSVGREALEIKWLGIQKAFVWLLSQPFELNCLTLAAVCGLILIANAYAQA
jgi:hypothetical protein